MAVGSLEGTLPLDVFVVFADADAEFVHGYLVPALGLPAERVRLLDLLDAGGSIAGEIDRGIVASRLTLVVISPALFADREAVFAEQLASARGLDGKGPVPLILARTELPLRLRALVAIEFTDRTRWDAGVERLRHVLGKPPPGPPPPIECPYPGMRPFTASDAPRFFGRDRERKELIDRLDAGDREIYVIGPSGSGKSSLVQAGLLPVLADGSSRLGRFTVRAIRPGERPSERLAAVAAAPPDGERVVVFVDQLEELFTLADAAERARFADGLRALRDQPWCRAILALRADFYGAVMDSPLWPDLAGRMSRIDVAPLRGAELRRAIAEPALQVGVYVEARLCDRLVADAAGEPGALPLVQETLRVLWDRRRLKLIGVAEYEALASEGTGASGGRGLDVAIARHADAAMRDLPAGPAPGEAAALDRAQQIARRVLLRLVSFGEGRADTRRQQPIAALRAAADDAELFTAVLQHLVDRRLVTVDEVGHDAPVADLSHEALISGWPALARWITERRADEQRRRRLDTKVDEWIERGRGAASLLDPVELAEAERWLAGDAARELGYGDGLVALVAASRSAVDELARQRRRRTRRAIAALATFSVVATGLGGLAWHQRGLAAQGEQRAEDEAARARGELAIRYQEQGRSLLLEHRPMAALPYLVAARAEGNDGHALRLLFAQAARHLPVASFTDHRAMIYAMAFSPDGTRAVTAGHDNAARIWDTATGAPSAPPLAHDKPVHDARFSPDGTRVVTASEDGTARVWDAVTGRPITPPLRHDPAVRDPAIRTAAVRDVGLHTAAFSPDGTRVVTASDDKTARVWNAATGQPIAPPLVHDGDVHMAAFSADGTRVVTASDDHTARVWDAATGAPLAKLAHTEALDTSDVRGAAFSPDGARVVTACAHGEARIWDVATATEIRRLQHTDSVRRARYSPDGRRIVTASVDRTAAVWDAATGARVTPILEHAGDVYDAAFSPDGRRVVTASADGTARVWDAQTGRPIETPLEATGVVVVAAFSPDGRRVVTAGDDGVARIWAIDDGPELPRAPLDAHIGPVLDAQFSRDGRQIVTAGFDESAQLWDVARTAPLPWGVEHRAPVFAAALSPDGTRIATASGDGTARLWDAATGDPIGPPLVHRDGVLALAISSDGTRVITGSRDGNARIWSAVTGAPLTGALDAGEFVHLVAFTADGLRAVTAGPLVAQVWDAWTGRAVTRFAEHVDRIVSLSVRRDGRRAITGSWDGTARIWNTATGVRTASLAHHGAVTDAEFSPDGTRVVTASGDGTAQIWNAENGQPALPPLSHRGAVRSAQFSPDGGLVITTTDTAAVRVWDAATGAPLTGDLVQPSTRPDRAALRIAVGPDSARFVITGDDKTPWLWTLPSADGSLDDWRRIAGCSPFARPAGVLIANPDPANSCPPRAPISVRARR